MPVTLTVHESQYPARLAEQLRQGLRTRKLPIKFLYDSPAQAQRWLTYHQAYSPSRTEPNLVALYEQSFVAALQALGRCTLHYISLGCGGGKKDGMFLHQAMLRGEALLYTPIDASTALVLETMLHIQDLFPNITSMPLVVDLESEPELEAFLEQNETIASRRLLSCFGMIPNFDYRALFSYIRRLMRPGDVLLLSANLSPGLYVKAKSHILPQYDNPLAYAWFAGLLDSLGIPTSQIALTTCGQPLRTDGHLWQIQTYARFVRRVTLTLHEESFVFDAGEELRMFFSNRFTPQVMPEVLAAAGLTIVKTFLFDSEEEAIYLCTCSAKIPGASH